MSAATPESVVGAGGDPARVAALEAELAEVRAALRASQAELHDVRSSLAFRAAQAASLRLHALAPPGTRRGRASLHLRAILRWLFRWRLACASRPARQELRAALRAMARRGREAPEIRHVVSGGEPAVFTLEAWTETALLEASEIEELMGALWASVRPPERASPS